MKRVGINEFVEAGYLQELNRRLLHPLGMALEVVCDPSGKALRFGGIWDYRDDPEGLIFPEKDMGEKFLEKFSNVRGDWNKRGLVRRDRLGYMIQQIPIPSMPGVNTLSAGLGYHTDMAFSTSKMEITSRLIIADPKSIESIEECTTIFDVKKGVWCHLYPGHADGNTRFAYIVHEDYLCQEHIWKLHPQKIPYAASIVSDLSEYIKIKEKMGFECCFTHLSQSMLNWVGMDYSRIDEEIVALKIYIDDGLDVGQVKDRLDFIS